MHYSILCHATYQDNKIQLLHIHAYTHTHTCHIHTQKHMLNIGQEHLYGYSHIKHAAHNYMQTYLTECSEPLK